MKELGPKVCVLKTDGINCDEETMHAFHVAGGHPKLVHVNELRSRKEQLKNYQILALPGGFSYGDDVVSGKILALELTSYLTDQINDFTQGRKGLVLGVCNGFQVLVRTGLLPFGTMGEMHATLTTNNSGHFECRWVNLKVEENHGCVFLNSPIYHPEGSANWRRPKDPTGFFPTAQNDIVSYQVAHGEGKFFAPPRVLEQIEGENLVVFRYCDVLGNPTHEYPQNPNGSQNAIAGICDPSGRILGLMPHPERAIEETHYPNWRRERIKGTPIEPQGLQIFQKMVSYVAQM